jgi:hypothetical protein
MIKIDSLVFIKWDLITQLVEIAHYKFGYLVGSALFQVKCILRLFNVFQEVAYFQNLGKGLLGLKY